MTKTIFGTQLDPPAHWQPYYPAIDELPATYAIRPLVVIPIQDKAAKDPNYHLKAEDILTWEKKQRFYFTVTNRSIQTVRQI